MTMSPIYVCEGREAPFETLVLCLLPFLFGSFFSLLVPYFSMAHKTVQKFFVCFIFWQLCLSIPITQQIRSMNTTPHHTHIPPICCVFRFVMLRPCDLYKLYISHSTDKRLRHYICWNRVRAYSMSLLSWWLAIIQLDHTGHLRPMPPPPQSSSSLLKWAHVVLSACMGLWMLCFVHRRHYLHGIKIKTPFEYRHHWRPLPIKGGFCLRHNKCRTWIEWKCQLVRQRHFIFMCLRFTQYTKEQNSIEQVKKSSVRERKEKKKNKRKEKKEKEAPRHGTTNPAAENSFVCETNYGKSCSAI